MYKCIYGIRAPSKDMSNAYMCIFMHSYQNPMSVRCSEGFSNQRPCCGSFIMTVIASCYCIIPISFSRSFSLLIRCYLGPLNQVTSQNCLRPREERLLSTVRTHCSAGEERKIRRLCPQWYQEL